MTIIKETISKGRGFKLAKEEDSNWQRKRLTQGKIQTTEIREDIGTISKDQNRIIERAREFYTKLYSSTQAQNDETNDAILPVITDVPLVLTLEIQNVIHQLKRNKAPGQDNFTSDLLKDSGDIIHSTLAHLFTECLKQR